MKKTLAIQRFWVLLAALLLQLAAFAQTKTISGKVTGPDGEALQGVSVSVQGGQSVQTGPDGSFTLQAAPGARIQFSSVGFALQSVTLANENSLNILLTREERKMDEVVVVGYGTQSRRSVTTSIAKLDKEVLASAPRGNIGGALQGSVPGLQVVNGTGQPGAAPQILLRGGASINNPGAPLVVVDGVIRSFNDIPSEDIASIELLKDAASTAIYGARANNGVILITTKQGRSGKAEISYKFVGGYNQRRDIYDYFGAKDFIYYNRLGNFNSGRTLSQVNSSRGYGIPASRADSASFDIRKFDGTNAHLLNMGWDTVGDPYGGTIIFKDHGGEVEDLVFRNTYTQDHYVNVTGGNDKGKYFASFDYYSEDGIIVGSKYKRYSGNINGSYKVRPNVEVSTGVNMSTASNYGTIGGEINTLYRSMAIWPTFNPWLDSAKTQPNPGNGSADGNPLYWLSRLQRKNEVNRITANAAVKWDILPGLYVRATGNAYLFEQLDQSFQKATQNYTNIFTTPQSYASTSRQSYALWQRSFQQQYNAVINYTKTFADRHTVGAMMGAEYFGTKAFDMQVLGTNAPTDDIPTVNASTTFVAGNNYTNESEYRILSSFGRLTYDYDNRFLLTGVFRRDGVSSLASGNRWGFFPGMSAGWNLHNEAFYQNLGLDKYISTFKPRVSYGENGNVAGLGRYEVQGGYGGQGLYNGAATFLNTSMINSNLRWENSKTVDVGLDLAFLRNKITVIFDYYNRKTSDLLTNLSLPSYTGFGSFRTNLGTFQNKGIEVSVNAAVLNQPNGFSLNLGGNASFVKNKILELPFNGNEANRQGGLQVYDPRQGRVVWVGGLQEGRSMGDIYAFQQVSIFANQEEIVKEANTRRDLIAQIGGPGVNYGSGKIAPGDVNWLDVDRNDTIDSRDQVYMGNIYPKWTGGFSANLGYKGLSLYTRFEFATGHTIYNDLVARTLGNYQGTFNYFDLQKEAWSPTNTRTDVPKVYYADQVAAPLGKKNYTRSNNANGVLNSNNSRFYEKGDYLALRELTLSYEFPRSVLAKTGVLSQSRVYVSANNLFYLTKFSGPSPEPPVSGGITTGVYAGTYPTPKTYVLGVQVSF
ncbi:SusC/RagA family TonB-linked outer membrane protein [Pseudocnuella soli]|uniref:SusC/RagA family TonB-linked outer membrane protein n=1 Tax=Pseudocnuella soli TaxID=2502779 RepID=UPI001043CF56|nr:SusC/RagA family TonB-linked outer membrane protein [Pseudocnuella soli]